MKQPHKPPFPQKPPVPSKTLKVSRRFDIHDKISWTYVRKQIPANISDDDIYLIMCNERDPYNYDHYTEFFIEYYISEDNKFYDRQVVAYEKSVEIYNKKLEEYKPKLAFYIEKKKEYDAWAEVDLQERRKRIKDREIADLKKRLAKLEKKKK